MGEKLKTLLIIDMQIGFMNKYNQHLVDGINKLIYKKEYDNLIYTKFTNKKASPFVRFLNWNDVKTRDKTAFSVAYLKGSLIFDKSSYGLTNEQIQILKDKKIEQVYLCGTDIDACVLAIAYQLFDNNIRPIFLMEYCGSGSGNKKLNKELKPLLERNFGIESIRK